MSSIHKSYVEITKTCTLLDYSEKKACNSSLWIETWMDEELGCIYRALFPEGYNDLPSTYTTEYAE